MLARTTLGAVLFVAGLLAVGTTLFVAPHIRPVPCQEEPGDVQVDKHDWWAFHSPQLGGPAPRYNASQDVTYIVPGCGHSPAPYALRVEGNHTDLRLPFKIVLSPARSATGETHPVEPPLTYHEGRTVDVALAPTFRLRSAWGHVLGLGLGVSLAALGLSAFMQGPRRRLPLSPPLAALLAHTLAFLGLRAGAHFVLFLFGLPVLVLGSLVAAWLLGLFGRSRPGLRVWSLAFLLFGLTYTFSLLVMADMFPTFPEA